MCPHRAATGTRTTSARAPGLRETWWWPGGRCSNRRVPASKRLKIAARVFSRQAPASIDARTGDCFGLILAQHRDKSLCTLAQLLGLLCPLFVNALEDAGKSRAPEVIVLRRKIAAGIERCELGCQKQIVRPAAASGRDELSSEQIDRIDVRPLFAIDFDVDEPRRSSAWRYPDRRTACVRRRDTSNRCCSRSTERSACSRAALCRKPRGPTDTSRRGCGRAAAGTDCSNRSDDWCALRHTGQARPSRRQKTPRPQFGR